MLHKRINRADTLGRFFAILCKIDKFCDFLFPLQYTKSILKRDLL